MEETKSEMLAEASGSATNGDEHSAREPTLDEVIRELAALTKGAPPVDRMALGADWRWYHEHWGRSELTRHRGRNVAIKDAQVVAVGSLAPVVRLEAARRLGVNPEQLVVVFIDGPEPEIG